MILEVNASQVIEYCLDYFNLSADTDVVNDPTLLSSMLRRTAGFLTPCSRTTLRNTVQNALSNLPLDKDGLSEQLDHLIEDLLVVGDLLELSDVSINDERVSGTWIFAAPPSFIVRDSGTIFIVGVVPDQENFLSPSLEKHLETKKTLRWFCTGDVEKLAEELREHGLHELSESVWLKFPKQTTAAKLFEKYEEKLSLQGRAGEVRDIQVLDPSKKNQYYRGRWVTPDDLTGSYIARRPQEYGSPIWCYVRLLNGEPQKLLDLPLKGYRWRPCDAAWHLQMAIDHQNGTPQFYTKKSTKEGVLFEFYSPLPVWAQRRLIIIGQETSKARGLFSYLIPDSEVEQEEKFLKENLWMICRNN